MRTTTATVSRATATETEYAACADENRIYNIFRGNTPYLIGSLDPGTRTKVEGPEDELECCAAAYDNSGAWGWNVYRGECYRWDAGSCGLNQNLHAYTAKVLKDDGDAWRIGNGYCGKITQSTE